MSNKIQILIVEDEAIVAMETRMSLTAAGFSVVGIASTGRDAIRLANEKRPDIVLMDIMLREQMTGVEAAKEIRKVNDVPVIFITGNSDNRTRIVAETVSNCLLLFKPLNTPELLKAIRKMMEVKDGKSA